MEKKKNSIRRIAMKSSNWTKLKMDIHGKQAYLMYV